MSGEGSNFLLGQENWDSKIPLRLTLAATDITTTDDPPPLYVQCPRMGYLPAVAELALTYFRHVLPPGEDAPWFEAGGVPLRWNVPVGVLFDLFTAAQEKPWALTVHFRGFPASLPRWEGPASLRAAYVNALKEAAYICSGSAAAVMGMASGAQDELWASVSNSNFGAYFRLSESMGLAARREGRRPAVPLRLYIRSGSGAPRSQEAVRFTSRPVPAAREDGSQPSLGDTLAALLPEYFEARGPPDNSNIGETAAVAAPGGGGGGGGNGGGERTQAASPRPEDEGQQWLLVGKAGRPQKLQVDGKQVDVWLSGIRPRLDAPLAWLHSQLRHPDHFLYVVLHVY